MSHNYSPPSFTCQSPQYMRPLPQTRFPSGGKGPPTERDAHIQRLS
jgi:hypothetical protein